MRPEIDDGYDPQDESDDLAPLLDLKFILLIALIVVLTYFAQQELDNRFAVPAGPGSPLIAVSEQEYQRMLVVSLDAEGRLAINDQEVSEELLTDRLKVEQQTIAPDGGDPVSVVFNADPTVPHGDAERVHLRLLRHGFTVLKEYQETTDEL
jgi:biopolymer transport protein ExbD